MNGPAYQLRRRDDGGQDVLVGDLVIGSVVPDGDLWVGRDWTTSRTRPHATQGECVAGIWRVWQGSESSRRAGLLPERIRYVCDAVAALRVPDGWSIGLTESCDVSIRDVAGVERFADYSPGTGVWSLSLATYDHVDHRTLQAVVDHLAGPATDQQVEATTGQHLAEAVAS